MFKGLLARFGLQHLLPMNDHGLQNHKSSFDHNTRTRSQVGIDIQSSTVFKLALSNDSWIKIDLGTDIHCSKFKVPSQVPVVKLLEVVQLGTDIQIH
jgi:hypothetical protein